MTIKEAILKCLDEINDLTTYMDVYNPAAARNEVQPIQASFSPEQ